MHVSTLFVGMVAAAMTSAQPTLENRNDQTQFSVKNFQIHTEPQSGDVTFDFKVSGYNGNDPVHMFPYSHCTATFAHKGGDIHIQPAPRTKCTTRDVGQVLHTVSFRTERYFGFDGKGWRFQVVHELGGSTYDIANRIIKDSQFESNLGVISYTGPKVFKMHAEESL